jgi:hypothetical protein
MTVRFVDGFICGVGVCLATFGVWRLRAHD